MSSVICAIRGGPNSLPTIQRAINLAKETQKPLHFLYVVNLDFLAHTSSSRTRLITHELEQMGDFILLNAQETARSQDIEADGHIRHGNIMDEIIGASRELDAAYVVLGQPRGQEEGDIFTLERLKAFIQHVEEQSGAEVVLAERLEE
jgi:nucleotide-binding universal stress UspA family protein